MATDEEVDAARPGPAQGARVVRKHNGLRTPRRTWPHADCDAPTMSSASFRVTSRRGETWLVDFGEPVGREQAGIRPAVVVSTDALNEGTAGVVLVVPVTSTHRDLPSHVKIEAGDSGLDHPIYAKCEDVESVSGRRLVDRLGVVGPEALLEIGRVLRNLLEL